MNIIYFDNEKTIEFAASELGRYLREITCDDVKIRSESKIEELKDCPGIRLGLFDNFNIGSSSKEDDYIYVDIYDNTGIIAGSNPGSVLTGVYRYLRELGCRFLRPGGFGEYIPVVGDISNIRVYVNEKASYRHRGIAIEGANSCLNVLDTIDWAAKNGFNSYFFQHRQAYTFYDRWYSHKNNEMMIPEPFTINDADQYMQKGKEEIKKRGMRLHAVGHGWVIEPLGVKIGVGEYKKSDIPPELSKYIALINGNREIWNNAVNITNLCYSKPEVRHMINIVVVEYLKNNKSIDYLHFWLADGKNNHCECSDCQKMLPADYYVMMLNELDALLTRQRIDTKIVFLIYNDLFWAPQKEKITNKDRFVMMFAPISRSYSSAFTESDEVGKISEYKRNKLEFPKAPSDNLMYLNRWREIFDKDDSFDFDYHFMWDHYMDPGYMIIPEVLYEDIKNLESIGLNGYMSCQPQRTFFPTGLGMHIMGSTLWDKEIDYDKTVEDYFIAAYGEAHKDAFEYLKGISELFDPDYLRDPESYPADETVSRLSKIHGHISSFLPVINAGKDDPVSCRRESWEILKFHARICDELASVLIKKATGEYSQALDGWKKLKVFVQESEQRLQSYLDVFTFIRVYEGRIIYGDWKR